jgi:hypothetical protein
MDPFPSAKVSSHGRGRGFESRIAHRIGAVEGAATSLEGDHRTTKAEHRWRRNLEDRKARDVRYSGSQRWRVRYRTPHGRQRPKGFRRKADAERFLHRVEVAKESGSYVAESGSRALRVCA